MSVNVIRIYFRLHSSSEIKKPWHSESPSEPQNPEKTERTTLLLTIHDTVCERVSAEHSREGRGVNGKLIFFTAVFLFRSRLSSKTDLQMRWATRSVLCISIKELGRPLRSMRRWEKDGPRESKVTWLIKDFWPTQIVEVNPFLLSKILLKCSNVLLVAFIKFWQRFSKDDLFSYILLLFLYDMKIRVFSSWEVTSLLQGAVHVLSPIHEGTDMLHLTEKKNLCLTICWWS